VGAKGHQIVALIAEANLNASTREKIKAILARNDTLAKASIWPDEVRKALAQMNPLHYVDVPRGTTVYDRQRVLELPPLERSEKKLCIRISQALNSVQR